MISEKRYNEINTEVDYCINVVFDSIKATSTSNYILILAFGEYHGLLLRNPVLSPYLIDYTIDRYKDQNRLKFLAEFLNSYYGFVESEEIYPEEYRIHLELMIYTHIWESKPFLKTLYRIAKTLTGECYPWTVSVPDNHKFNFLSKKIIQVIENNECSLSEIIKKGYHSSLRNAFAHSQYHYDLSTADDKIYLDNYKREDWEMKFITFNVWTERFVYSALLSYHIYNSLRTRRINLSTEFDSTTFKVEIPSRNGIKINTVPLGYNETNDEFYFVKRNSFI